MCLGVGAIGGGAEVFLGGTAGGDVVADGLAAAGRADTAADQVNNKRDARDEDRDGQAGSQGED